MKYPNVLLNSMTSKLLLKGDKDAKIRTIRQFPKNLSFNKEKDQYSRSEQRSTYSLFQKFIQYKIINKMSPC